MHRKGREDANKRHRNATRAWERFGGSKWTISPPTGPAAVGGAAALAAAQTAYRKRQKESYGMLTRHITNTDIVEVLMRDHFQDGFAAYNAVIATGRLRSIASN